jgi:hypothetical protein
MAPWRMQVRAWLKEWTGVRRLEVVLAWRVRGYRRWSGARSGCADTFKRGVHCCLSWCGRRNKTADTGCRRQSLKNDVHFGANDVHSGSQKMNIIISLVRV